MEKAGFSDVEHSNKAVDRTRISTKMDVLSNKDSVKNVKKPATAWFLEVNKSNTRPESFEVLEKPTVPPIPTYTPKKQVFRAAQTSKKASQEANSQLNFSKMSSSTASKARGIARGVQAGGRDRSSDLLSMKDFHKSFDSRNRSGLRGPSTAASVIIREQNRDSKLTPPVDELSDTELIQSDRGSPYMPYTGLFSHSVSSSKYASAHEKSMQIEDDFSSPFPGYAVGTSSARSPSTMDRSIGPQSRSSPINTNFSSPRSMVPKPIPINGVYFLAQEFMSSPVLDCLDSSIPKERSSIEDISKSMLSFDI